jgi:hypothetical protein
MRPPPPRRKRSVIGRRIAMLATTATAAVAIGIETGIAATGIAIVTCAAKARATFDAMDGRAASRLHAVPTVLRRLSVRLPRAATLRAATHPAATHPAATLRAATLRAATHPATKPRVALNRALAAKRTAPSERRETVAVSAARESAAAAAAAGEAVVDAMALKIRTMARQHPQDRRPAATTVHRHPPSRHPARHPVSRPVSRR